MAKTEYEKWTDETRGLIKYLVSIRLKNNEEYQSASNKRKHEIKEETWKDVYVEIYPDTKLGIAIRKERCEPPRGLSGKTTQWNGYTVYFSSETYIEQWIRVINDGEFDITKAKSGDLLRQFRDNIEDLYFNSNAYIWINHDDKIALIGPGLPTTDEIRAIINNRLPMNSEIFVILKNWRPYRKEYDDDDIRDMASIYFPGKEDICVTIARKGYDGYLEELQKEEEFEKHKTSYQPTGRRVKVKDMRPGYLYTFTDMSLEAYSEYVKGIKRSTNYSGRTPIYNAGIMKKPFYTDPKTGKVRVWLWFIDQCRENIIAPSKTGRGIGGKFTGNYLWNDGCREGYPAEIERYMDPDDYVVEAYPFPVGIYREGIEMEWIPNPDQWETVSSDKPHTRQEDYVQTWDQTDFNILIILTIVSVIMIFGGIEGISLACSMWALAAFGFHVKHKRIKEEILEERRKRGIRGNGMDHHFKY